VAVSVCPDCGAPEIVGGALTTGGAGAAATVEVAAEVEVEEPALFDAVTATRMVAPTSAAPRA